MDSNTHHVYDQDHLPADSSLLRFRSAPSSSLATFSYIEKGGFDSDGLISRFLSSNGGNGDLDSLSEFEDSSPVTVTDAPITYTAALPLPPPTSHSGLPPHYPRQSEALMRSPGMDVSYQFLTTNQNHHSKPLESNLVRQSSSPAGMFTNLSVQNGYGSMKSLVNCGADEERSLSSKGLKRHCSLSTRSSSSSLGMLSQISELENEIIGSGVQYGRWNDPSSFIDNFPRMKTEPEKDKKMFSGVQNVETVNRIQMLTHHLSLPKKSSEMGSAEKFLQFQDSVPCKIRARRGCATHPRSIAERVRRTRISERMKKLQELVPYMDKQTNTADMLDLAVEYIKDLQRQFKNLSDIRANCKCLNSEKKPMQNQAV